jgi:hypothetical protein
MLSIKSLVEKLDVFERNKVPLDLKVLGLAFYVQLCSLRRAARALSEIHRASKTAVWKWVRKLSGKICIDPPRTPRRLMALDEAYEGEWLGVLGIRSHRRGWERSVIHEGVSIQERIGHEAIHRGGPKALRRDTYLHCGQRYVADKCP